MIDFKKGRQRGDHSISTTKARFLLNKAKDAGAALENDLKDRIEALEAYIDSFDGEPDQALSRLSGKENPHAIRRRLSILIDLERYGEAADLIRGREPEAEWCEKAITVLVQNQEFDKARSIIEWAGALEDPRVKRRCILTYAESGIVVAFRDRGGEPILPGRLTGNERSALDDVLQILSPLLHLSKGNERVTNALEEHAIRLRSVRISSFRTVRMRKRFQHSSKHDGRFHWCSPSSFWRRVSRLDATFRRDFVRSTRILTTPRFSHSSLREEKRKPLQIPSRRRCGSTSMSLVGAEVSSLRYSSPASH